MSDTVIQAVKSDRARIGELLRQLGSARLPQKSGKPLRLGYELEKLADLIETMSIKVEESLMESARIPDIEIEETPMHGSKMQVAKEPLTPQKIADSVNQIWDIYWSGQGLSDQDLVDAIVEHIKEMK